MFIVFIFQGTKRNFQLKKVKSDVVKKNWNYRRKLFSCRFTL